MTKEQLDALIPAATPLLTWGVKSGVDLITPRIPKVIWPLVCAGFGVLADWLASLATGQPSSTLTGLALGMAGVAVRETLNQLPKAASQARGTGQPPADPGTLAGTLKALAVLAIPMFMLGCSSTSQKAFTDKDGGKSIKSHTFAVFQADQSVGKTRVSAGSVLTAGASEINQQADAGAFTTALGNAMGQGLGQVMLQMMAGVARPSIYGQSGVPATNTIPVPVYNPADASTWPVIVKNTGDGRATVCWANGACVNVLLTNVFNANTNTP